MWQAVEVMGDHNVKQYASGQNAYRAIIDFMMDDRKWSIDVLEAQLFEQVVVYGDAMVMLCNRASAATFFEGASATCPQYRKPFNKISKKLMQIAELPQKMCSVLPMGWNMSKEMIECICKPEIRKEIAGYFTQAKKLEARIIETLAFVI